jgi:ABC-type polysaccharide/polyol phosphate export permease
MLGKIKELYKYREVLLNFIDQELKIKYKRSALGFFLVIIESFAYDGGSCFCFFLYYEI